MRKFAIFTIVFCLMILTACSSGGALQNGDNETASANGSDAAGAGSNAASGSETAGEGSNQADEGDAAAAFPDKTVEWIVPYSAGGANDVIARILAPYVQKHLPYGKPVVVRNVEGGGGTVGLSLVLKSEPDGSVLGNVTAGNIAISPHFGETDYDIHSFKPVVNLTGAVHLIVTRADSPWNTLEEWVEYVKANPGAQYGVVSIQGTQNLVMQGLSREIGMETTPVVYAGESGVLTSLLGGDVKVAMLNQATVMEYIKSGEVRPLANVTRIKPEDLKDVPTLKELGYQTLGIFLSGIVVHKDTPDATVAVLKNAFDRALEEEEVKQQLEKIGAVMDYMGPEEFGRTISDVYDFNGVILRDLGMLK